METKPLGADGTIKLSPEAETGLPAQMTDPWIEDRIGKLAESSDPNLKRTVAILRAAIDNKSIVKVVAGADAKSVTFVKLK